MREADRNALLNAADRRISRCGCGSWVWSGNPCGTCAWLYTAKEDAA